MTTARCWSEKKARQATPSSTAIICLSFFSHPSEGEGVAPHYPDLWHNGEETTACQLPSLSDDCSYFSAMPKT